MAAGPPGAARTGDTLVRTVAAMVARHYGQDQRAEAIERAAVAPGANDRHRLGERAFGRSGTELRVELGPAQRLRGHSGEVAAGLAVGRWQRDGTGLRRGPAGTDHR